MDNEITCDLILKVIYEFANNKYEIDEVGDTIMNLLSLAPETLTDKTVVRLQRVATKTRYRRTFAVTALQSFEEIHSALRWAAEIKTELLDPESADLYLIAAFKNRNVPTDRCISIESGEQFCRKYILRSNEAISDLIARTFLGLTAETNTMKEISDPLLAALSETAKTKEWLTAKEQEHWRSSLLSGKASAELVELLFGESKKEP